MAMLADAKHAVRVKNDRFDGELLDLIDAARADLMLSGVSAAKAVDGKDPLIKRAILCYVKANFGWDNPDSEKLARSYDMLKAHLTLSREYTEGA